MGCVCEPQLLEGKYLSHTQQAMSQEIPLLCERKKGELNHLRITKKKNGELGTRKEEQPWYANQTHGGN